MGDDDGSRAVAADELKLATLFSANETLVGALAFCSKLEARRSVVAVRVSSRLAADAKIIKAARASLLGDSGENFFITLLNQEQGICRLALEAALDDKFLRSEEHTSELQSQSNLVCRLLLEKKNKKQK